MIECGSAVLAFSVWLYCPVNQSGILSVSDYGQDGHDLRAVPKSDDLLVTMGKSVQLFDRTSGKFRVHPLAGELQKVKAIDIHPVTGRIVYSTWSKKLTLLSPAVEFSMSGNIVYKCRWFVADR